MAHTQQVERTGWTGWVVFAGVMMIVVGALQAIYGLVAVLNDDWVVWGNGKAVLLDITAWGWIHLIGGALVALAGFAVMAGQTWARVVGIILAVLSAFANFTFIPYYPFWAIMIIAVDVFVIWALAVHGRDLKA